MYIYPFIAIFRLGFAQRTLPDPEWSLCFILYGTMRRAYILFSAEPMFYLVRSLCFILCEAEGCTLSGAEGLFFQPLIPLLHPFAGPGRYEDKLQFRIQ